MVEEVGELVLPAGQERVVLLVDDEVVEEVEKIVVLLVERLVLVAEVEIVELSVLLVDDLWSARSKGS